MNLLKEVEIISEKEEKPSWYWQRETIIKDNLEVIKKKLLKIKIPHINRKVNELKELLEHLYRNDEPLEELNEKAKEVNKIIEELNMTEDLEKIIKNTGLVKKVVFSVGASILAALGMASPAIADNVTVQTPKGEVQNINVDPNTPSYGLDQNNNLVRFPGGGEYGVDNKNKIIMRKTDQGPTQQDLIKRKQVQDKPRTTPTEPDPQDKYQQELAKYDTQIKQNPNDATLYIQKAEFQMKNEDTNGRINTLETSLKQKLDASNNELFKIYYELGICYSKNNNLNKAIKSYELAKKADPNNELAKFIDYNVSQIKLKINGSK